MTFIDVLRDERVTPWDKMKGTNWRLSSSIANNAWDLDLRRVDVERSTGNVLREDWQVNAGLRIPF